MALRMGIIGAGNIGSLHAKVATETGVEIAAICDVDKTRAETLAASCGASRAMTTIDELLNIDDITAVAVAVPNVFHKDVALAVLGGGKDLLLEKPMATNVAECDEIVAAIDKTDQLVQVGFVCRYAPASRAVKAFIDAGRLGNIYHARATLYRRRGIPGLGRWFTQRSTSGGGVLVDIGVHMLDLTLYLTGHPSVTRANGVCTSTFGSPLKDYLFDEMWAGPPDPSGIFDVEDGATAMLRCDNGMTIELATTWAANIPDGVTRDGVLLMGDKGGCFFDLWKNEVILATEQDGYHVDTKAHLPAGDAWMAAWHGQYEAFAHNVASRTPPQASAADGRTVQAVLDAIYRSAAENREVEVE